MLPNGEKKFRSFDMPDVSREYLRDRIVAAWRNFKSDLYTKYVKGKNPTVNSTNRKKETGSTCMQGKNNMAVIRYNIVSFYFSFESYLGIGVTLGFLSVIVRMMVDFGALRGLWCLKEMTHLLNGWTYGSSNPFQLMLALTIFKFLTALVSCATAITLVTLIPLPLKVKVRELFLKKKAWELDREVGMMKKQKEASWHVRMLTQGIRKSLDGHTILYTTLIELSNTLDLQNCTVWMPNESRTEMKLTHELKGRNSSNSHRDGICIPINDLNVLEVKKREPPGAIVVIRMPMLIVSDFKGGTPELIKTCYAILVLVLPSGTTRVWSYDELEIVKVVADQVAVAVSHAAILEESQLMKEKLVEKNRQLQHARKEAMMASQARNSFQKVMSKGMRRPMHSISGLLSMIKQENMGNEQNIIIGTMVKISSVLSTLINDVMEISTKNNGRFPLEMRYFHLHSMIKETACLAKCVSISKGFSFSIEVENSLPDRVMADERRVFQIMLHMVGNLLNGWDQGLSVTFRASAVTENDQRWAMWRSNSSEGYAYIKFETGVHSTGSQFEASALSAHNTGWKYSSGGVEGGLSFTMCKKLVQMMQGNIWVVPNSCGLAQTMTFILRFQLQPASLGLGGFFEPGGSSEHPLSNSLFRNLQVILADDDGVNRIVTKKLLEKLGCRVIAVSSGYECLSALGNVGSSFQIVILDLHMPEKDGFEVAMRVQKFRSRSWPLIVALTASEDEDVWEKCMQVGMNGLIRKPVLLQGMADELRRVIQHGASCSSSESTLVPCEVPLSPPIPHLNKKCTLNGVIEARVARGEVVSIDPTILIHGAVLGDGFYKILLSQIFSPTCPLIKPDVSEINFTSDDFAWILTMDLYFDY
ncbi:hypothetical protein GIB67_040616 [Kingdonia uniflora]|uniref:Ethylene receptor n=1 Tax=Kingdonia uniflora TaxID=39325 RepID=A0A7J7M8Z6_9MAGN|nr:hypothetical protein GIB67_040616 [Kingdonia uniflora]